MTKEMRPSHRVDVLSDGFSYFSRKVVINLSKVITMFILKFPEVLLPNRLNKSKNILKESQEKLNTILSNSPHPS